MSLEEVGTYHVVQFTTHKNTLVVIDCQNRTNLAGESSHLKISQ